MRITSMTTEHVEAVVDIHTSALREDFLPSLGRKFLSILYEGILALGAGLGYVALDGECVCGFVLATLDSEALFKKILREKGCSLALAALNAVVRRPRLTLKVAETFLYPSKERMSRTKAELVVIAVSAGYEGQSIGTQLVHSLEQAFLQLGVHDYKVTVHQDKHDANRFYQRLGFKLQYALTMYQKEWNLYTKHLCQRKSEGT